MMRRIVTPLLLLLFLASTELRLSAYAMELSDLPAHPDEKKVERKPAIILSDPLTDEEIVYGELKKDVNKNLENLNTTTKVLKDMGVVKPDCADCESLTNKKRKGRSPAVEIRP